MGLTEPCKVTAMTMKPIDDGKLAIMRSNLAVEWGLTGGGPYSETIRTEDAEIQGVTRSLTYVDWVEDATA